MKSLQLLFAAFLMIVVFSDLVLACPVCFGVAEESKTNESVNMAVWVLLGTTGVLLSLFAAFFVHLKKRMKMTLEGTFDYPNLN